MRSTVASARGTEGDKCPLATTCSRSQISNNSSSSSLTTSTAQPASRSARIEPRICAAAPTSTPQVGCETMSNLGLASISRPTMNFCRLPPDSDLAAAWGPPAFTLKRRMMSSACFCNAPTLIQPLPLTESVRVSSRLCAKPMVGTAPRPRRSSGTKCRPKARRWAGPMRPAFWPATWTLAASARWSSPDNAYSSSFCPLPDTPAMPTTSPALTSNSTSIKSTPNWSARGSDRFCTRSTVAPACAGRCSSAGGSAPIIRRDREALVSSAGLHTPVTLPPRSTVQAVHSARISCSLWLM